MYLILVVAKKIDVCFLFHLMIIPFQMSIKCL